MTVSAHTHSSIFLTHSLGQQIQPECRPLHAAGPIRAKAEAVRVSKSVLIYIYHHSISHLFITCITIQNELQHK